MHNLLLISKYLRSKLAPLFAAVAVTLCTLMVVTVISVMGGFLSELRDSAKRLTGDLVISNRSLGGFDGYEALAGALAEVEGVERVTPSITAYGLFAVHSRTLPVLIQGVVMEDYAQVVAFEPTLMWAGPEDPGLTSVRDESGGEPKADLTAAGLDLRAPEGWLPEVADDAGDPSDAIPAMVLGVEVNPYHQRDANGQYHPGNSLVGITTSLTVAPVDRTGAIGSYRPVRRTFMVVNEFKSGLYDVDKQVVYVPFAWLQKAMEMHPREVLPPGAFDPETGLITGDPVPIPGRATELVVKVDPKRDLAQVQLDVQSVIDKMDARAGWVIAPTAQRWDQVHARLLQAVGNEKGLVTFLFAIISLVAVVMVATTFYMIVLEKTRDIGLVRAIGGTRGGVLKLFLGYGLAIGTLGAGLGLALAVALVLNLNAVQDFIAYTTGWRMWDPQTYFFDRIPTRINPWEAGAIAVGAVISSVIGALIPAWLASRVDPIRSLRYE